MYIKKYLVISIILFILGDFAFLAIGGDLLSVFSSGMGLLAKGFYILPIGIALLGLVKNQRLRITSMVLAIILFVLIGLNAFVFGIVRI